MKLLLFLAATIAAAQGLPFPGPGSGGSAAPIALLAHGTASCGTITCTTGNVVLNTTGATLLVIIGADAGSNHTTADSLTDSNGNTWTKLTEQFNSVADVIWYSYSKGAAGLTVGAGHTFSYTGHFAAVDVRAYSGTKTYPTDPFDVEGGKNGTSATFTYASFTCSQNNSLLVAAAAFHALNPYTITASFTNLDTVTYASGVTAGLGGADLIQAAAAAVTPAWTQASSSNMALSIACFKGL